jgi:hypothetical protein
VPKDPCVHIVDERFELITTAFETQAQWRHVAHPFYGACHHDLHPFVHAFVPGLPIAGQWRSGSLIRVADGTVSLILLNGAGRGYEGRGLFFAARHK